MLRTIFSSSLVAKSSLSRGYLTAVSSIVPVISSRHRLFSSSSVAWDPKSDSGSSALSTLEVRELPGSEFKYAVLNLNRGPANTLNNELLLSVIANLDKVNNLDKNVKGLVLTSSIPNFFCGGIDLKMFKLGKFLNRVQECEAFYVNPYFNTL